MILVIIYLIVLVIGIGISFAIEEDSNHHDIGDSIRIIAFLWPLLLILAPAFGLGYLAYKISKKFIK